MGWGYLNAFIQVSWHLYKGQQKKISTVPHPCWRKPIMVLLSTITGSQKKMCLISFCVLYNACNNNFLISGFQMAFLLVRSCLEVFTEIPKGPFFSRATGNDLVYKFFEHSQLYVALPRTAHTSIIPVFLIEINLCKTMVAEQKNRYRSW